MQGQQRSWKMQEMARKWRQLLKTHRTKSSRLLWEVLRRSKTVGLQVGSEFACCVDHWRRRWEDSNLWRWLHQAAEKGRSEVPADLLGILGQGHPSQWRLAGRAHQEASKFGRGRGDSKHEEVEDRRTLIPRLQPLPLPPCKRGLLQHE